MQAMHPCLLSRYVILVGMEGCSNPPDSEGLYIPRNTSQPCSNLEIVVGKRKSYGYAGASEYNDITMAYACLTLHERTVAVEHPDILTMVGEGSLESRARWVNV